MTKRHMTRKELGSEVYVLSDNQMNTIRKDYRPIGYNAGVYGWNYDIYFIKGKTLVYGYRPLLKWKRLSDEQFYNLIK